jgi:hypothetical protein
MTDGKMIRTWKEVVIAYLYLPEESDEHKNLRIDDVL